MGDSFWSDPALEPKRAFRWILLMGGVPQWIVKKVSKPSYELGEAEHQYINHTFYYPGRVTWQPVNVTLVDPVSPDASKTMQNIIQASGYEFPRAADQTSTISKAKAVSALGKVTLQQIGSESRIVEQWTLFNPWIQSVNFGELDYSSDDLSEIELTIRYDFAVLGSEGEPGTSANNV